jgi:hypothetical protein
VMLVALGLAVSAGNLAGAWDLQRRLRRRLPMGDERLGPSLLRTLGGGALMAGPAYVVAATLPKAVPGHLGALLGVLVAVVVGALVFLWSQRRLGASPLSARVTSPQAPP